MRNSIVISRKKRKKATLKRKIVYQSINKAFRNHPKSRVNKKLKKKNDIAIVINHTQLHNTRSLDKRLVVFPIFLRGVLIWQPSKQLVLRII